MSPRRIDFTAKGDDEQLNLAWDFQRQLEVMPTAGVTLVSGTAQVTATVHEGTDATPQAIVSGAASVSGTRVIQRIIGGVVGVTYCLEFQVTTSNGAIIHGRDDKGRLPRLKVTAGCGDED